MNSDTYNRIREHWVTQLGFAPETEREKKMFLEMVWLLSQLEAKWRKPLTRKPAIAKAEKTL